MHRRTCEKSSLGFFVNNWFVQWSRLCLLQEIMIHIYIIIHSLRWSWEILPTYSFPYIGEGRLILRKRWSLIMREPPPPPPKKKKPKQNKTKQAQLSGDIGHICDLGWFSAFNKRSPIYMRKQVGTTDMQLLRNRLRLIYAQGFQLRRLFLI